MKEGEGMSQRTYMSMYDPWTRTMTYGLPEDGEVGAEWRRAKGEKARTNVMA